MRDTEDFPSGPSDEGVTIAQAGNGFWLLQGDHHLDALLAGKTTYPTPVNLIVFASGIAFDAFLFQHRVQLASLWGIHPAVIERLKRDNEMITLSPPDAA